jgi:deoxyribonuclease-1
MNYKHDVVVPEDEYLMFLKWSLNDPPDEWGLLGMAELKSFRAVLIFS